MADDKLSQWPTTKKIPKPQIEWVSWGVAQWAYNCLDENAEFKESKEKATKKFQEAYDMFRNLHMFCNFEKPNKNSSENFWWRLTVKIRPKDSDKPKFMKFSYNQHGLFVYFADTQQQRLTDFTNSLAYHIDYIDTNVRLAVEIAAKNDMLNVSKDGNNMDEWHDYKF